MSDPVVGHKTFVSEDGTFRHEPLYKSEAKRLHAAIEEARQRRADAMPDVRSALVHLQDAYQRLKELGFQDASYATKDGSLYDVIEVGSTGIHKARYRGTYPDGCWWVEAKGDLFPSHPILCRKRK